MFSNFGLNFSPVGGVNNFKPVIFPVKNVTASALVKYGVYALDIARSDGDVDSLDKALSSVIAVATASISVGMLVVVQSAIAAGGIGDAVFFGPTMVGTIGTTDIAKMDALKGVNAAASLVKATPATDRWHGIALEANATDTVVTNILAMWDCMGRF